MIIMNFGSRYVIGDITDSQEQILKSRAFKTVALFCMFFIGTRDVLTAMILTSVFLTMMYSLLNEKNKYTALKTIGEGEYKQALEIVQRYEKEKQVQRPKPIKTNMEPFLDGYFYGKENVYSY